MREMAAFGRSSLIREGGYCIMSICLYKLKKKKKTEKYEMYMKNNRIQEFYFILENKLIFPLYNIQKHTRVN